METSQDGGARLASAAGAVIGILIRGGRCHGPITESPIQHPVAGAVEFVDQVVQGNVDKAHFEGRVVIGTLRSESQPEGADVVQVANPFIVRVSDEVAVFLRDHACEAWHKVGDGLDGLGQREGVEGIDMILESGAHGVRLKDSQAEMFFVLPSSFYVNETFVCLPFARATYSVCTTVEADGLRLGTEAESDMDVGSCLIPHGQRFSPSTPLASKSHVNGLSVLQYSIFVLCYFEVRLEPFPAYPAICLATGPWRYAGVLTHERVLIAQHLSFSPERIVSQETPNRITRITMIVVFIGGNPPTWRDRRDSKSHLI